MFLGCAGLAAIWLAFAATMRYKMQPCLLGCHYEYINKQILLLGLSPGTKNPVPRGTGYGVVVGGRLGGTSPATTKPMPKARVVREVWAIRYSITIP